MSDYGLNFGFRRSDESSRSAAEGRFKTPAGSSLLLGTMVEIDPANAGYMKQSASGTKVVTGFAGLLLQELDWDRSIFESDANYVDTSMKGVAKANRLAVITSGAGTKIWLKNSQTINRADGRVIQGRTIVDTAGLNLGVELGWDGTKWAAGAANPAMKVTFYNPTSGLVETVLNA